MNSYQFSRMPIEELERALWIQGDPSHTAIASMYDSVAFLPEIKAAKDNFEAAIHGFNREMRDVLSDASSLFGNPVVQDLFPETSEKIKTLADIAGLEEFNYIDAFHLPFSDLTAVLEDYSDPEKRKLRIEEIKKLRMNDEKEAKKKLDAVATLAAAISEVAKQKE